ncbi:MAG: hypothetical protein IJS81_08215 [Selenomonadaceae bacterium]|nr:hypothetical protein [Selenomonadaceae bacterium]
MINFLKISCDEIQSYTEQATQDLNSHVNVVIDNLSEKMKTTINQTDMMAQNVTSVTYRSLTYSPRDSGGGFCYHKPMLKKLSLTRSPARVDAPTLFMF